MNVLLSLVFLSAVSILCINAKCSNNPRDWCETYENAKQCDVSSFLDIDWPLKNFRFALRFLEGC